MNYDYVQIRTFQHNGKNYEVGKHAPASDMWTARYDLNEIKSDGTREMLKSKYYGPRSFTQVLL